MANEIIKFWNGMIERVGLKKTDKLMVGNVDTDAAEHTTIEKLFNLFTTDDLTEGTNTKRYTNEEKLKVSRLPENTNLELDDIKNDIETAEENIAINAEDIVTAQETADSKANQSYVDSLNQATVKLTTNQKIDGSKTFKQNIKVNKETSKTGQLSDSALTILDSDKGSETKVFDGFILSKGSSSSANQILEFPDSSTSATSILPKKGGNLLSDKHVTDNVEDADQTKVAKVSVIKAVDTELQDYKTSNDEAVGNAQTKANDVDTDLQDYKTSNNTAVSNAQTSADNAQTKANDVDTDLQDYKTSNNQSVSDAQTSADNAQDKADSNEENITKNESLLLVGSDAYTHAKRVQQFTDGQTFDLTTLDAKINKDASSVFSFFPNSIALNKIPSQFPDNNNGDFSFTRNGEATLINKKGIREIAPIGIPRLDWSKGVAKLLIEPFKTQMVKNSAWVGDSGYPTGWLNITAGGTATKTNSTLGDLQIAYRFRKGLVGDRPFFTLSSFGVVENTTYCGSVFIEAVMVGDEVQNILVPFFTNSGVTYYKNDKEITANEIVEEGYTYYWVATATATETKFVRYGLGCKDGFTQAYVSDVTLSSPQIEEGTHPTSFIISPVGATATRLAETNIKTLDISDYLDVRNMVLRVKIYLRGTYKENRFMSLSDGTSTNRLAIGSIANSNNIAVLSTSNGVSDYDDTSTADLSEVLDIVLVARKGVQHALYINGVQKVDTVLDYQSEDLKILTFSSGAGTSVMTSCDIEQISVYNSMYSARNAGIDYI